MATVSYKLVATHEGQATFLLFPGINRVGRDVDSDILLSDDASVSRYATLARLHARVHGLTPAVCAESTA